MLDENVLNGPMGKGLPEGEAPGRDYCYQCRRPRINCQCPTEAAMDTNSRLVLLMHPKEYRRQKTGTGRIACLNLAKAEIIQGIAFDENPRVRSLIDNPDNRCALLYPGQGAIDLSIPAEASAFAHSASGKQLVVFLIDSTWSCAHAVISSSPGLLGLPRLQFKSGEKSRWIIKRQPKDYYLSTIEAIHELLLSLEAAGLEDYRDKERLIAAFMRMQNYQVQRAYSDHRVRYLGSGKGGC